MNKAEDQLHNVKHSILQLNLCVRHQLKLPTNYLKPQKFTTTKQPTKKSLTATLNPTPLYPKTDRSPSVSTTPAQACNPRTFNLPAYNSVISATYLVLPRSIWTPSTRCQATFASNLSIRTSQINLCLRYARIFYQKLTSKT